MIALGTNWLNKRIRATILVCIFWVAASQNTVWSCEAWSLLYDSQRQSIISSLTEHPNDYTIVIRHTDIIPQSDFDKNPDNYDALLPGYCSGTTPPLSKKGIEHAKQIQRGLENYSLDLQTITTSPICRAHQTAATAFGEKKLKLTQDMELREEGDPRSISLRNRINEPSNGGLSVLVSHSLQIKNATSIEPACGETLIVQKTENAQKSICVARILPDEWLVPQDYSPSNELWQDPQNCASDALEIRMKDD